VRFSFPDEAHRVRYPQADFNLGREGLIMGIDAERVLPWEQQLRLCHQHAVQHDFRL